MKYGFRILLLALIMQDIDSYWYAILCSENHGMDIRSSQNHHYFQSTKN